MSNEYPMIKSFFLISVLLSLSSICCAAHGLLTPHHEGEADRGMKIFIFNGTTLIQAGSDTAMIKPPVTEGLSFAVFFLKRGYLPVVKVIKATTEDVRLEKVLVEKPIETGMGFLTGVVYKSIHGGKISRRTGILTLIKDVNIEAERSDGEEFNATSGADGVYGLKLPPGKYKVFIKGSKESTEITIEKTATTIQNLRKGLVLRD